MKSTPQNWTCVEQKNGPKKRGSIIIIIGIFSTLFDSSLSLPIVSHSTAFQRIPRFREHFERASREKRVHTCMGDMSGADTQIYIKKVPSRLLNNSFQNSTDFFLLSFLVLFAILTSTGTLCSRSWERFSWIIWLHVNWRKKDKVTKYCIQSQRTHSANAPSRVYTGQFSF